LSVDVDLVLFNITVLDGDGRTVSGLSADHFQVHEDGREQTIKVFQPEDTPATVGLVIDNSGSMMNRRADVVTAALAFVGGGHPDDEMLIGNFNQTASVALPNCSPLTQHGAHLPAAL